MVADYEKLGIVALPDGGRDWLSYTSMWRAKNTQTFKSGLLEVRSSYILTTVIKHTQMHLIGAKTACEKQDPSLPTFNATYGEYTVGGDTMYRLRTTYMSFKIPIRPGLWLGLWMTDIIIARHCMEYCRYRPGNNSWMISSNGKWQSRKSGNTTEKNVRGVRRLRNDVRP